MNRPRFQQIGFGWRSHVEALHFLGSLYLDPHRVLESLERTRPLRRAVAGLAVYCHLIPYLFVACLLGRMIFSQFLTEAGTIPGSLSRDMQAICVGLALGAILASITALIGSLVTGLAVGVVSGTVFGIVGHTGIGPVDTLNWGAFVCPIFGEPHAGFFASSTAGFVFGLVYGSGVGFARGLSSATVLAIGLSIFLGVLGHSTDGLATGLLCACAFLIGWTLGWSRWYYLPRHAYLFWKYDGYRLLVELHPVFWDQGCGAPFPRLDRLLLRQNADPSELRTQIQQLIHHYPSQRRSALRAWATLLARNSARVCDLTTLAHVLFDLPQGKSSFLSQTASARKHAVGISRQQRNVNDSIGLFLKEQSLLLLHGRIETFRDETANYDEPLSSAFRRAATVWLDIADRQLAEVRDTRRLSQGGLQVFRYGDPVNRDAEAFVPRGEVLESLATEIMRESGSSGFLLSGCRRMGKSTLIRNLDGFLPDSVVPVVISMQNPEAFTSGLGLAKLLVSEIQRLYPESQQISVQRLDLPVFFAFLRQCNEKLQRENRRLLLAVDEFEEIDFRIGKGQLDADFPKMLRESFQSQRQITWLFVGTKHFSELKNVPWGNYLVSVQTFEIPLFTPAETRSVLMEPLKYSRRAGVQEAAQRLQFNSRFWGEYSVERIHDEAGGWPHLVQLIAAKAVALCQREERDRVDDALLDKALAECITSGDPVLAELMLYRSEEYPNAWNYLSGFRTSDCQGAPSDDLVRRVLKRHLLVKETDDGQWRLRVPLMRRWLREKT